MYNDLKMKLITSVFELASGFVSTHYTSDSTPKEKEILDKYYNKMTKIAKEAEKYRRTTQPKIQEKQPVETPPEKQVTTPPSIDMTMERIESGVACLACSRDHFSTASAMLNEALRFAREKGVSDWEVQRRLGIALDELNAMERGDLHATQIQNLQGKEKEIANNALNNSRDLRHRITAIKDAQDLESTAAKASNIRTKFMKDIFDISSKDGTIDVLCKNLDGAEKQKCIETINKVLEEKLHEDKNIK